MNFKSVTPALLHILRSDKKNYLSFETSNTFFLPPSRNERKGDFITWGVPIFFFFIQNGANFAQSLLWVPKTRPQRKNLKKIFLTSYLVPLKKWFFAPFTLFLGVRKYFFVIQNVANFAQPLLWILRTPLFKKNHNKIFSTSYLDPLKMWHFCSFYAFTGGS